MTTRFRTTVVMTCLFYEVFHIHTTSKCEGTFAQETSRLKGALVAPVLALDQAVDVAPAFDTTPYLSNHEWVSEFSLLQESGVLKSDIAAPCFLRGGSFQGISARTRNRRAW